MTANLLRLEQKLIKDYNEVLLEEQILWFQKSKEDIATLHDRNTRFFHLAAILRQRRANIDSLKNDEGIWVSDIDNLKQLAVNYFRDIFTAQRGTPTLLPTAFPSLTPAEISSLERGVSLCEVRTAIFSMGPYKSPGPDGFHPIFFQKFWNIVGNDIHRLVSVKIVICNYRNKAS